MSPPDPFGFDAKDCVAMVRTMAVARTATVGMARLILDPLPTAEGAERPPGAGLHRPTYYGEVAASAFLPALISETSKYSPHEWCAGGEVTQIGERRGRPTLVGRWSRYRAWTSSRLDDQGTATVGTPICLTLWRHRG